MIDNDFSYSTSYPSIKNHSEFHKNIDFAVLFNFGDNDFGRYIEAGAKLFCDEFNKMLIQIDTKYKDDINMAKHYINDFNELCKIENIKEVMKCGFLSKLINNYGKIICGKMPLAVTVLEESKKDMNYIKWDGEKTIWEYVGNKYVESEKIDKFIIGTLSDIKDALKKYGNVCDNTEDEFPVWCNGEVIILYMNNGYLTYITR